jgi:hypothetical protein
MFEGQSLIFRLIMSNFGWNFFSFYIVTPISPKIQILFHSHFYILNISSIITLLLIRTVYMCIYLYICACHCDYASPYHMRDNKNNRKNFVSKNMEKLFHIIFCNKYSFLFDYYCIFDVFCCHTYAK